jgi:hypothetical protein
MELYQAMKDKVLIVDNEGRLKMIADGLSQKYWVDMIKTIKVH